MRTIYFVRPFSHDLSLGGSVLVDNRIEEYLSKSSSVITITLADLAPELKVHIRQKKVSLFLVLLRAIFRNEPYNVGKFRFQRKVYRNIIIQLEKLIPAGATIVTSGWLPLIVLSDSRLIPKVHFAHNVEFLLSKSYSNMILTILRDWKKVRKIEIQMLNKYSEIFAFSEHDVQFFQNAGLYSVKFFPIFQHNKHAQKLSIRNPIRIGLLGSMHWPPNRSSYNTIVQDLLPCLRESGIRYKFMVAGNGSLQLPAHNNVTLLGKIDSTEEFYNDIDLVVVPRNPYQVTGISVKAVEALEKGKIVLADSKTASPFLESELAYSFTNSDEFLKIIKRLLND